MSDKHLCWDCTKASDASCPTYEGMSQIVEENFDDIKIFFQVKECVNYVKENK